MTEPRMTDQEDRKNCIAITTYRAFGVLIMLGAIWVPLFKKPVSPETTTNALLAAIALILMAISLQLKRLP